MVARYSSYTLPNDLKHLAKWSRFALTLAALVDILHYFLTGRFSFVELLGAGDWSEAQSSSGAFLGLPALMLWIGGYAKGKERLLGWMALTVGFAIYGWRLQTGHWDSRGGAGTFIPAVLGPLGLFVGAAAIAQLASRACRRATKPDRRLQAFFRLAVLMGSLGIATRAALLCTSYLFPATWDYHVYRIDAAFGAIPAQLTAVVSRAGPWLQSYTATAYSVLSAAFYVMVALAMRQRAVQKLHVWRVLVVPFCFAWCAYAWLPVSGPLYAFFDGQFPFAMPAPSQVSALPVVIPPAYRNGMPSMHLVGAFLVWLMAIGLRSRVAVLMSTWLVLSTAWATLASGEHYVLDLVVALPCAAFLGVSLIWPQTLVQRLSTAGPLWAAGVIFILWMMLLRAAPMWLSLHLEWVRLLAVAGTVSAVKVFWDAVQGVRRRAEPSVAAPPPAPSRPAPANASTPVWTLLLFVFSGLAGLIYEVVFAKGLAVTFGSTALASYTVLTVYMAGMAGGAWLGGRVADASRNPLRVYALCEAAVGIYAALTPYLFEVIQRLYVQLTIDVAPDAPSLTVLRVTLGAGCLAVPTLLMGATLPLVFKHVQTMGVAAHSGIARLYSANVVGAASGAVIAGYLLLPALGRSGTTYVAATISLLVALAALDRAKLSTGVSTAVVDRPAASPERTGDASDRLGGRRDATTALAVLVVGGAITLGLEVNSMHLLAVVAGNSVYAFALMLATFLAGLGLGSVFGEALLGRVAGLRVIAWAEFGLAASIGVTASLWSHLPSYFSSFGVYPVPLSFAARETIRALVCAVALVPPAFFIGLCYPAAMSVATKWRRRGGTGRGVGMASACNTLGNVLGVVLVGFWLLPRFGSRNVTLILALTALLLGCAALMISARPMRAAQSNHLRALVGFAPAVCALGAIALIPDDWDYDDLASGGNVYFRAQSWGKVIDHAESVDGGVTSVARSDQGTLTLLTNGKFQGNDASGGEMLAQESFALFPLLHTTGRKAALVIGYGTGMTARVLHEQGFRRIDVAELSGDIVAMSDKHFGAINHNVTAAAGVEMHYTDGRNFLLTQSRKFDVVSVEVTSIWFAGAANLYNRDFYALAKQRLTVGGVLQQWVQLHHIAPLDLLYVIGSVRSEFKYVWLYVRGGQGVIVASNGQPGADITTSTWNGHEAATSTVPGREESPEELRRHLVLSPRGIDRMILGIDPTQQVLVSTDKNLYLEHSTPKGNALGDVMSSNLQWLVSFERADMAVP